MENIPYLCIVKQNENEVKRISQTHPDERWMEVRQAGSHKIYEKDGKRVTVPYHGSKEMKKGLVLKLKKEMGL